MMNLATMSFDVVPGVMIGIAGPILGVIAAIAFAGVAYGFVALGHAAVHHDDRPTDDAPRSPVAAPLPAAWEITPTIAQLLRSASDAGAREHRHVALQRISSPRAAV
ncbi:hypothetical protein K2Z84_23010 [Candidatus Binatia bacterium]|jgi:hypothetical protein|nr:hypothetical protein [Candidatus Binatia bacterium]